MRVFWVLPDSKTNEILPLEVRPAPTKTVRVLVGRSEVIRPTKEQEWLEIYTSEDKKVKSKWYAIASGHFGIAYDQRMAYLKQRTEAVARLSMLKK